MRSRYKWVILILAALVLGIHWNIVNIQAQTQVPPDPAPKAFPQTGHWVSNEFLKTYLSVPDPERVFGYPITEPFQDETLGRLVQYFEKARFELFPADPQALRVRRTPIGKYLYRPGKPLPLPANFPACREFDQTGFQVCYTFLDFYLANGGALQFGYPISNFELVDGQIVQYFQFARFEWHPELPHGDMVVLSDLGRLYFETMNENPARLLPVSKDFIPQTVLALKVHAFTKSAVLPASGRQSLYIVIQDQNNQPVANAQVTLVITLPNGSIDRLIVPGMTNQHGILTYEFSYRDQKPGRARIEITGVFEALQKETITSFRIR